MTSRAFLIILVMILYSIVSAKAEWITEAQICAVEWGSLALQACDSALNSNRLSPIERLTTYYNRGLTHADQNNLDQAIRDFSYVIDQRPSYIASVFYFRGLVYQQQGNYEQAIVDYQAMIALNPEFVEAYYNRGIAYQQQGNYEQAIVDYQVVITLNPEFVEAYYNRGLVYQQQSNYEQAIVDYQAVIALNPEFIEAYYNRGISYQQQGNHEQAIVDFQTVLAHQSNDRHAQNALELSRQTLSEQSSEAPDLIDSTPSQNTQP